MLFHAPLGNLEPAILTWKYTKVKNMISTFPTAILFHGMFITFIKTPVYLTTLLLFKKILFIYLTEREKENKQREQQREGEAGSPLSRDPRIMT